WHPSVVLIDMELEELPAEAPAGPDDFLPGGNGRSERPAFVLCGRLQSNPELRNLPVLFLTTRELAAQPEPWLESALRAGGSDFVEWEWPPVVLQARLFHHVRLHETLARLRVKAIRDELTGLYSGQFLVEHLRQLLGPLVLHPSKGAVLAFVRADVDAFPELSRRLTPHQYEGLLMMVGEIIKEHCQADLVARIAQDKFAILLPGVHHDEVLRRAEATRISVERETALEYPSTISLGVASFESSLLAGHSSVDAVINLLLKHATLGVQQAQSYGGNQVAVYEEPTSGERRRNPRWEVSVRAELVGRYGARQAWPATDLSTGGVALEGVPDLKIGDHVEILIQLGEDVLGATGVVAWSGTVSGYSQRCGIAFESLAGDGHEVLKRYLAERARALADETEKDGD
ncbi:MAG: diguanylate cyclase, partial [Candidatus Eremiobacterota bacterium]